MIYSYYPGCTLKTKAKELDMYARKSAEALDITLEEIPEWQCCGAVYPMGRDEIGQRLAAIRALSDARDAQRPLVTVCSACHHVLTRVNNDMRKDSDIRDKANRYLELEPPYSGETEVLHYLTVLRDKVGFGKIREKTKNPFSGKRIGAYYGCMLLRPSSEMGFDDPEDPSIMEELIRAIGGEPVIYDMRNECCGGYTAVSNEGLAKKMAGIVMESANNSGADMLITACPLCMYNLDENGGKDKIPVYYFTELLAKALGVDIVQGGR